MKKYMLVATIILITVLAAFFYVAEKPQPNQAGTTLKLVPPPFVSEAFASDLAAYLDQEAGIAAWYKADSINLIGAKDACRTDNVLEIDTASYFICSVQVSPYYDHFYPCICPHRWVDYGILSKG